MSAELILGIDPGTAITGYGVVAKEGGGAVSLVECGVVRTSSGEVLAVRIRDIYEAITTLITRHAPSVLVVEDVFQGKNVQSALKLGHARGAILLAGALGEIPIVEYSPREIKKAVVGNGNATKDQVGFMVQQQLRLKAPPSPADAADGVAAALCHCVMGTFR
ncbi:MAG: crossover junction endodeoxyribonuclease RuvC [Gemmatimonadetes bacterium]|nr:crossover junction endodeoxyribonuclease RuvC [Gemmatimonadota bacterium]MCH2462080.1 crossover junction endodeoxyribonuclease RuvC [Gemmatimonadota bacterium]MEC9298551.1 crossover junction endodeoxyribonuclease RuvC [Gemmatimonadota bacterium]MED5563796.1 crossover junction endodeoxyribonuclease RuvC [Gemmatimonadota bacterium]MEE3185316.1 crossover junction endodeoxyribonuclease RuvC [Gemmatimonadota bacterium]